MMNSKTNHQRNTSHKPEKILLALLPYWDPMIPPNGIATLKSFLRKNGYPVKTIDLVVEKESLDFYNGYYDILRKCIPENKWGNFNNVGHDLLQNHLMAHLKYQDEMQYIELVKTLVYHSFYVYVDISMITRLNSMVDNFYSYLKRYFLGLLAREKPGVVGVTAYKCTLPASMFVLKLTKEKYPHIKTLLGGGIFSDSHAVGSPNFEALLKETSPYIDKFIVGQGELLFLKYLQGKLPGSQRIYTRNDINGEILDFSSMDIPDFSDFNIMNYPYLPATASSSCPFQCSFCNSKKYWGKFRIKEVTQTAAEMIKLYRRYGHQLFFMTDALLNPVITNLSTALIESGVSLYYDTYFRVDNESGNIENTMYWRRGGLFRVRLGTESGSQHVLDRMGKNITPQQIKAAVSALAYAGVKTTTYWVIGHPGETEEDFQTTLDLIEDLKNDTFQAECNPFLYHYAGQSHQDQWAANRIPLYPPEVMNMLVFQSWTLDIEPSRKEAYHRMHRFEVHCRKLGIPNPYSLHEHYSADERWKKLHKNAAPSLLEFKNTRDYIDENKHIGQPVLARNNHKDSGDFGF